MGKTRFSTWKKYLLKNCKTSYECWLFAYMYVCVYIYKCIVRQSVGLQRARNDWATEQLQQHIYIYGAGWRGASQVVLLVKNPPANAGFHPWVGKIPWRRAWQPTPVFWPGESHGQREWWATGHEVSKNRTRLKRLTRTHTHTHREIIIIIYEVSLRPQTHRVQMAVHLWEGHSLRQALLQSSSK